MALAAALWLLGPLAGAAPEAPPSRAAVLTAARELMAAYPYCALVSVDPSGAPSIRTMNPFPPDERMTVWFATHDQSRKIEAISKNPKVVLYYGNHQKAEGYVALQGVASLVTDPAG
jgi:general stress protein 26